MIAPEPERFAAHPPSWYVLCSSRELRGRTPLRRDLCGRQLVGFRDARGEPGVLDARCPHLGADLRAGRVAGGRLECPYHGWRFDVVGRCSERGVEHTSYPVGERYGQVFVFLGAKAAFPLPEFEDLGADALVSAEAAKLVVDVPWYMIGAQAFDMQHFRLLHHRELLAEPVIDAPHPQARRIVARFAIRGGSWVDRLTRHISGEEVEFSVTVWGGNVILVRTRFREDRTYGCVVVEPVLGPDHQVELTLVTSAVRGRGGALGAFADVVRVHAKRFAVLHMMNQDLPALNGLQYHPRGMSDEDRTLAEYLGWVASLAAHSQS